MTSPDPLAPLIDECLSRDRPALERDLARLQKRLAAGKPADRMAAELERRMEASRTAREARRASLPKPRFPEDLPVSEHREEIAKLISDNPVVVICGETGSGKTTQLPKICLELGRGVDGFIGHTQPRRIAARSVAARIAEELDSRIGEAVGFKVRFSDHTRPESFVKLMTDGILLAELRADPELRAYDTLIIDEAHERSLNVDFLLGYLRQLMPRRPDLKLIITSATLDPERIAGHFGDGPVYEVPGRTWPVEVRYRPVQDEDAESDRDLNTAIVEAVDELAAEGTGDVLVFLPGEREIREAAEALRKHHPKHTEILPLYARLSASEQNKVFAPHTGRRVVLATNVAETALTVPGIRYVVDSGLARVSRYAWRSRVQRLSLEPISRASASQRAGRCGRLGPGVCVRLYSEEDFSLRPEFTDPEILRSNLASVILQMANLNLGDPERFPFVDAPDARLIRDGYKLLEELGAVDARHRITDAGRKLARLPVDPRLGAMLLAAGREGAVTEVTRIVAFLAIQDPRERPAEKRQAADEAHAQYREAGSDFLGWLKLWDDWREQQKHLSKSKLRAWCRERFLSFIRIREWQDLHGQLRQSLTELGLKQNQQPAEPEAVHRALLAGLVSQVGMKAERGDYLGARNRRFHVHPASGLFKKNPAWVMAAEITETTRVYARECAAIQPGWLETVAPHLLKHHYFEPHFEARRGTVAAFDRVTLYGLTVNPKKRVNYGRIDPADARRVFIREGLVAGRLRSRAPALEHNRALIREIEDLEARGRRRDLLADEQVLYDFYDSRIPDDVHDGASFERWRRQAERENPGILRLTRDILLQQETAELGADRFPDSLETGGVRLPLTYRFEPGTEDDGVTMTVPLAALNGLDPHAGEWLVPGLLEEKIAALIKSLPKGVRRQFVPVPEFARACVQRLGSREGPLIPAITRVLREITGTEVPPDAWRGETLDPHLVLRYRVVDAEGQELAAGRDLEAIKSRLSGRARETFDAQRPEGFERAGLTDWDFGELPEFVEFEQHGATLRGYPALRDDADSVALVLADSPGKARRIHRAGLRRLFMLQAREPVKYLYRNLPDIQRMCLQYNPVDRCEVLKDDLVFAGVERVFMHEPWPRDADAFRACLEAGRGELVGETQALCELADRILGAYQETRSRLKGSLPLSWIEAAADIRDQIDHLIRPHFLLETPREWLEHFPRYLAAIQRRLDRLDQAPDKDRRMRVDVEPLWEDCKARLAAAGDTPSEALVRYRWLIEELRVGLFAQELGTVEKASVKRVEEARKALG